MARISLDPPRTLSYRLASWFSRRRYGAVLDPAAALAHNLRVGWSYSLFELQVERWKRLDSGLKDLAVMAAAASIGCSWCMDFGYWESITRHDVMAAKIRAIPDWQDSEVFTELERLVMLYAEAMTMTPPLVTDDLVARLRQHLDEAQMVELTAIIAVENLRSRTNSALGLTAQGFKDRCELEGRKGGPEASQRHSELEGRGAAWTEERGTSDEGRRRLKGGPEASQRHSELEGRQEHRELPVASRG